MADLDVSLRLRLINMLSSGVAGAINDLKRVEAETEKINRAQASGQKISASAWVENQRRAKEAEEARKGAQKAIDDHFRHLERKMAEIGQMQWAFFEVGRLGDNLKKPIEDATGAAVEFEKRIQSIAKAGGMIAAQRQIGEAILHAAKAGNISWEELARGERQIVALGGGDYLGKIGGIRDRLAQLINASEANPEDLYNLIYHYMHLLKMTPEQALSAAQVNYVQGKKGALELKDLAEQMPRLIHLGQEYMSNQQVATDLVALLEVLRKQTGSASQAETLARHAMMKLSDPGEAKRIYKALGLDIYAIRKEAAAQGKDQLFAVLNAIADKFKELGNDPKKLGEIGRDYHFRAALEAFMKMRDDIKEYMPTPDEANKTTMADFAASTDTAAASLERLAIAAEEARIRTGESQVGVTKGVASIEEKGAEGIIWFAKHFPALTAVLATGESAVGSTFSTLGGIGSSIAGLATALLAIQWGASKFHVWRNGRGGAAPETPKGAPSDAAKPSAVEGAPEHPIAEKFGGAVGAGLTNAFWISVLASFFSHGSRVMTPDQFKGVAPDWFKQQNDANATDAGKKAADAVAKGAASADMKPAGEQTMTNYAAAITAAGATAIAAAEAIAAKIKATFEFTATPTIQPRLAPSSPAAGAAAPQKHAQIVDKSVHIGQAHFHGVQDIGSLHRQLAARLDHDTSSERASALHDMDVGGMG